MFTQYNNCFFRRKITGEIVQIINSHNIGFLQKKTTHLIKSLKTTLVWEIDDRELDICYKPIVLNRLTKLYYEKV